MRSSSQLKISISPNGKIIKKILNPLKVNVNAVFEGGGPRGLVYVGVIQALAESGIYPDIRLVVGSSAGALTALTVALGFTANEAAAILKGVKPLELLHPSTRELLKTKDNKPDKTGIVRKLLKDGFLDSGDEMQKYIEAILARRMSDLHSKFPHNQDIKEAVKKNGRITFQDLDKIKNSCPEANIKHVVITGTKKNENSECKLFDVYNTPNMPIALAGRISASIPIFFKSVPYEGHTYCDGGCANNFPAEIAERPEYAPTDVYLVKSRGEVGQNLCTLGFKVDEKEEMQKIMSDDVKHITTNSFITGIVNNIVGNFTENAPHTERLDMLKAMLVYKHQTCIIHDRDVSLFEFALDDNKKNELIAEGYKAAKTWLKHLSPNNSLEIKEYQSVEDLCQDMTLEEFGTFREILAQYPTEIFEGSREDLKKFHELFNRSIMNKLYETKKSNVSPKVNDVKGYFFQATNQSATFLSILASLRGIKDANDYALKKITEGGQKKQWESELVEIKRFIFQEFYINKVLSLIKDISSEVVLTDIKINTLLFQAVWPSLDVNPATKDDANFLKTSAARSQGGGQASICWNCVASLYRRLYKELWSASGNKIIIDDILKTMETNYSEIAKIIIDIHTRLPRLTDEEKAKYFLKSLESRYPDLMAIIMRIAREQKLEDYSRLDLPQMNKQKSVHHLLDSLNDVIRTALNKSNPSLMVEFFSDTLKKDKDYLLQEIQYWSQTKIDELIKSNFERIYGPIETKSHPLEEDDSPDLDISRFYEASRQIGKLLQPMMPESSSPKLSLRSSSDEPSTLKKPLQTQSALNTFGFLSNNNVVNKNPANDQVFTTFFDFIKEAFATFIGKKDKEMDVKIVDQLNKLRSANSTNFSRELLSGEWNENRIIKNLDAIAKQYHTGSNSAAVTEVKNHIHDLIVSNLARSPKISPS